MKSVIKKVLCLFIALGCVAMTFACSSTAIASKDKEVLITGKTAQYFIDEAIH